MDTSSPFDGRRRVVTVAWMLLLAVSLVETAAAEPVTEREKDCQASVEKAAGNLAKIIDKSYGKCRDRRIAGKITEVCPGTKGQAKIDKFEDKLLAAIEEDCGSVCWPSPSVTCLSDLHCPPDGAGATETCAGDAENPAFAMENLGFPGPLCEAQIGGPINGAGDLNECLTGLIGRFRNPQDLIWGAVDQPGDVSEDAAKCLAGAGKATTKLAQSIFKGVSKCHDAIRKGKSTVDPERCTTDDAKLAKKITKAEEKLAKLLDKSCPSDALVAELDLCVGGVSTVAEATTCLTAIGRELGGAGAVALPDYVPTSMVAIVYPSGIGTCGDGLVNQLPNAFALIGEECDVDDDSACPGACLPPGDLFECTCGDIPRAMSLAIGSSSDLEIGWTGFSHDHKVSEDSAFIVDITNCDCTEMAPGGGTECVGSSTDPVCTADGHQLPTCSWDVFGSTRCDDRGDTNGNEEDEDCFICDAFNVNAGALCADENDCQAQCYDADGTPTGTCTSQADCAPGERCRGQCDRSQTCVVLPHGAPLAQSTAGAPSCLVTAFREDMTGTQNLVTGEHARFQERTVFGHTGFEAASPCPVCGGFCDGVCSGSGAACKANVECPSGETCSLTASGAVNYGRPCQGTCSASPGRCRFDSDCPSGETCTTAALECGPGICNLELICRGGPRDGLPCRVEGITNVLGFGITSNDCPPDPALNFSGSGTPGDFLPATSEPVSLEAETGPCTQAGQSLYDCMCTGPGGIPSQPNLCAYACNAGAELGTGCATGLGNLNGVASTCAGGDNDGMNCDEDSDCAPGGGTCSDNPSHCIGGDPAYELAECTTNAECAGGGTCTNACPSGQCMKLCLPKPGDPEDGQCAGGPDQAFCDGPIDTWRTCPLARATAGCSATCSVSEAPCMSSSECPTGETCSGSCLRAGGCEAGVDGTLGTPDDIPGAGKCTLTPRRCFLPGAHAEGGDTLNGEGGPVIQKSVSTYCIPANPSPTANVGAGLPGPGRLRVTTLNLTNGFASLP